MENAQSGDRTVAGIRRDSGITADSRERKSSKIDPRSRAVNRSSRADRHASFADEVLRDLNPRGPLERLAADHVVHNAWKLKTSLENQGARDRSAPSAPEASPKKARIRPTELDRASRALKEALEALDFLRARFQPTPEVSIVDRYDDPEILSNEWPVVPCDGLDEPSEIEETPGEEVPSWHDRLVFDFEVSDVSPVVKGTWITVGHVVSLIVDGWAWADILRSHPELTEDDIRTCVAYAMAEENTLA